MTSNDLFRLYNSSNNETDFIAAMKAMGNNENDAKSIYRTLGKYKNNTTTNNSGFGGGTTSVIKSVPSNILGALQGMASAGGEKANLTSNLSSAIGSFAEILNAGLENNWKKILTTIGGYALQGAQNFLEQISKTYTEINENSAMSGDLAKDFRNTLLETGPFAERLGIDFQSLSSSVGILVSNSGKFKVLDEETINNMSLASKFVTNGIEGFSRLASEAEKYSMGIDDTSKNVQSMMKSSIELGLNYKKVIEGVDTNLKSLNQYGFKNGIEGLAKMSQKAIEFRMNLESTFNLADKVWSPEGSLELVANLQMIGGAVGDLNDPLKLMYMATNNIEGLQDSLINATKSLATYNQEQGRFEITGANLRRMKEMATTLGVSYDELANSAIAAQERLSASTDLMSSGLKMDDKDKEFLTNMARMEGGKMVISVNSPDLIKELGGITKVSLQTLTSEQAHSLLKYREELKDMSPLDVAKQQVSLQKNLDRNLAFLVAKAQLELGKKGNTIIENVLERSGYDSKSILKSVEKQGDDLAKMISLVNKDENKTPITSTKLNNNSQTSTTAAAIRESYSKNNTPNSSSTTTKEIKQNVVLSFKSDNAITDKAMRSFFNDDYFQEQLKDSYLFTYKKS